MTSQPLVLAPVPSAARALRWRLLPSASPSAVLEALQGVDPKTELVGLGPTIVARLGASIPGLHPFSPPAAARVCLPSHPADVWLWLHGQDRGRLVHRTQAWQTRLKDLALLDDVRDMFTFEGNRDLSGYEDGTENPEGSAAESAALLHEQGPGLDGSSFVAVHHFMHDIAALQGMSDARKDDLIGRRISDNEEFEDAPVSAHVKRAAQESFSPEAFIVRRSMPWTDSRGSGLVFVAFGRSFAAYEAILARMTGAEDGVVDGLFQFTTPLEAAFYWCPPVVDGRVDFRALTPA